MRKQALVLAVALAAAGCGQTPFPVIQTQMNDEKGEPVKALFAKLGAPDGTAVVDGEKAYVWSTAAKDTIAASAAAEIGFHCTLRVFVNRDEKVAHYDFKGNVGGCAAFAHRLDKDYNLIRWTSS